jgi:ComF family protein
MLNRNFISWLRPFGMHVLDMLLPPNCLACDTPVDADGQFCLPCFRKVNFISTPLCRQCGVPLPYGGGGLFCQPCAVAPPAFTQARAALRYDEFARNLILPFKYADRTSAARGLALLMSRAGAGLLAQADILVPVPLHKSRLRQRRFNQSALLASELSRIAKRPVLQDALIRHRATIPLGPLGLPERRTELDSAISARPSRALRLVTQKILLIDDVMTSGATANACAMALLAAGAVQVNVLTTARVPDPRSD